VSETPTRYGVTPSFFESVVRYSRDSGARILPMREAWTVAVEGHVGEAQVSAE
jgi:hypothetical protein